MAIAAELPHVGLEDALAIVLALLEREPERFERAAARWEARMTIEHWLTLSDAPLTMASIAALPGHAASN